MPYFFEQPSTVWLGEGIINLRDVKEGLRYFGRWTVTASGLFTQEIEIHGIPGRQLTEFSIEPDMSMTMEHIDLGLWKGTCRTDKDVVEWKLAGEGVHCIERFIHLRTGTVQTRSSFFDEQGAFTVAEGHLWLRQ